jgi:hypothetical protein
MARQSLAGDRWSASGRLQQQRPSELEIGVSLTVSLGSRHHDTILVSLLNEYLDSGVHHLRTTLV